MVQALFVADTPFNLGLVAVPVVGGTAALAVTAQEDR